MQWWERCVAGRLASRKKFVGRFCYHRIVPPLCIPGLASNTGLGMGALIVFWYSSRTSLQGVQLYIQWRKFKRIVMEHAADDFIFAQWLLMMLFNFCHNWPDLTLFLFPWGKAWNSLDKPCFTKWNFVKSKCSEIVNTRWECDDSGVSVCTSSDVYMVHNKILTSYTRNPICFFSPNQQLPNFAIHCFTWNCPFLW